MTGAMFYKRQSDGAIVPVAVGPRGPNGAGYPTFTKSGSYLGSLFSGAHTTNINFSSVLVIANGYMILTPFWVPRDLEIESVGCYVSTGATDSGSQCRFGLYAPDSADGPSILVEDFGAVDIMTTGEKAVVVNRALSRGLWWVGMKLDCPTTTGTNPGFYGNQIFVTQQSTMNPGSLQYASLRFTMRAAFGSLVDNVSDVDLDWAFNYHHPRILLKVA